MNIDEIKGAAKETISCLDAEFPREEIDIEAAVQCARFLLSHPFGVLKPLKWAVDPRSLAHIAFTPVGEYCIPAPGTCWWLEDGTDEVQDCDSIDHGKQLCEQHYAESMAKAFKTIGES